MREDCIDPVRTIQDNLDFRSKSVQIVQTNAESAYQHVIKDFAESQKKRKVNFCKGFLEWARDNLNFLAWLLPKMRPDVMLILL